MVGFVRFSRSFSPFVSAVSYFCFLLGFLNLIYAPFYRLPLASADCGSTYATGLYAGSYVSIRISC